MRRIVFVLVVVFALVLAACSSDDDGGTTAAMGTTGTTASTGATGNDGANADCADLTGEGATFTIKIAEFAYDPSCFTASASQGIKIVNKDDVDHTFTIPDTQIDVPVAAGETFNGEPISGVLAPGTYDFMCTIHPKMTGRVTVVA